MGGLSLVVLVGIIGLLMLAPTRRLFVAGFSSAVLTSYFFGMLLLGVLLAEFRGPARFLVPILVIAYIVPFVTAREGISRLLNGPGGGRGASGGSAARFSRASRSGGMRPPMKNVTPQDPPPTGSGGDSGSTRRR